MYVHREGVRAIVSIPEFQTGEVLALRVRGLPADLSATILWQGDKMSHLVRLMATGRRCP